MRGVEHVERIHPIVWVTIGEHKKIKMNHAEA